MKQRIIVVQLFFSNRVTRNFVYGVKGRSIGSFRPINCATGIYCPLVCTAGRFVNGTAREVAKVGCTSLHDLHLFC